MPARSPNFIACRILALFVALISWPLLAQVPSTSESAAFNAAARALNMGAFDRALKEFRAFITNFPHSSQIPEAVLMEAVAAVKLADHKEAVSLLSSNLPKAGVFTEQYRYWLGEAHLQGSNFLAAADSFARVIKDFPESPRVLEASYGEALARFRLKEWSRVIQLLQSEDGSFQKLARTRANDEIVSRGFLLLAEALLEQKDWAAAEAALNDLTGAAVTPELKWQRQSLLCRLQLAQQKLPAALAGSSNLVTLADAAASSALRADSIALQAGILQQLQQFPEAAAVYEQNLRKDAPAERRRQALLKIVELTLAQDAVDDAAKKLERLLADHPAEAGSDFARLSLGELRLKQYFAPTNANSDITATNSTSGTNALQSALAQFDEILKSSPQSSVAGKAQLDRGWCLWESGKIGESALAFKWALDQLPHSQDQAVARFKLGDALLYQGNYSNALDHFRAILTDYTDIPSVKRSLVPHALYHSLRCNIELNNLAPAADAMREILNSYADTSFADKSLILLGQQFASSGRPRAARQLFSDFGKRFPGSTLLSQVDLALARSYVQEKNWDAAIREYDQWVDRYPTNQLRPQAEFSRGWAYYQAGRDTNALTVFTNLLADFPTNELAASALRWVADFYYRQGDFENAERNYQILFQSTNWPPSHLTYEARMLAGKAALARQGYKSAAEYFRSLINDDNSPPDLKAEAFFALGDTMVLQDPEPGKSPAQKFDEAKVAYKKIPDLYPTNRLVPPAWGAIANCWLQMAAFDAKYYENAKEEYQKVLSLPYADISTRSQAEVGLGAVFEKQARLPTTTDPDASLEAAFNHYFNVLSGKTSGDEQGDIFWMKQAGLAAALIAEERKQWNVAINIYNTVSTLVPSLRPALQRKIDRLREQSRADAK